jgi:hypothetical protein
LRVLLDEDIPHSLRHHLPGHDVITVWFAGWSGLKNGNLLRTAQANGIEVFVTADQSLPAEQNLKALRLGVVVLTTPEWRILSQHLATIAAAVDRAATGTCEIVKCGRFER